MMTKCPSKSPNLWNTIGCDGTNDDQTSFKETKFVKQNLLRWVKWWPNVLESEQSCETELVGKGQMMTKCPSKWPILWDRSVLIGSNDDEMSLKVKKFVRQNWLQSVKWWPNVLQRDQLCETELVANSNDDQMSFKEFMWLHRVKWWPNVLQRVQILETELDE